jgi:hypothetical protein
MMNITTNNLTDDVKLDIPATLLMPDIPMMIPHDSDQNWQPLHDRTYTGPSGFDILGHNCIVKTSKFDPNNPTTTLVTVKIPSGVTEAYLWFKTGANKFKDNETWFVMNNRSLPSFMYPDNPSVVAQEMQREPFSQGYEQVYSSLAVCQMACIKLINPKPLALTAFTLNSQNTNEAGQVLDNAPFDPDIIVEV